MIKKIKSIFLRSLLIALVPSLLIALGILEITFSHALDDFFNIFLNYRGYRGWPGIILFFLVLILWLLWNKVAGVIILLIGSATAVYLVKTEFFGIKEVDCSHEETQEHVADKKSLLISATRFAIKKSLLERKNGSV
jgi:hypothetical protein